MKKTSLNELMGGGAQQGKKELGLSDLEELLGERMPKLDYTPVGRMRLTTALRNRFGDNYRHLKGIEGIIEEFDREIKHNVTMAKLKMLKGNKGK